MRLGALWVLFAMSGLITLIGLLGYLYGMPGGLVAVAVGGATLCAVAVAAALVATRRARERGRDAEGEP